MYIPVFIAILMGLISSTNYSSSSGTSGTVYVNSTEPTGDPDKDPNTTPPEDGTGGDTGHVPPPRPKP